MEDLQEQFNQALRRLGPFEDSPHLAVAVSGGSDSLCLAFLAHEWVQKNHGHLTALIVDHGLRPSSPQEALDTQALLKAHGFSSALLKWEGEKPVCRIQERARQARYDLLGEWCQSHGVLHLLLGHHENDQWETFHLRQEKHSGTLGLSCMASILETPTFRLLRPLLNFSKASLRQFLNARGIPFLEDPSNSNPKYSRTALRQKDFSLEEQNDFRTSLHQYGLGRIQEEQAFNALVSQWVEVHPEGYGSIEKKAFYHLPESHQVALLKRCIMTFGVGLYPPRRESLRILRDTLETRRTLQGCLIFNHQNKIIFAREPAKIGRTFLSPEEKTVRWDDRFTFSYDAKALSLPEETALGPLQEKGWRLLKNAQEGKILTALPYPVRIGLPALWQGNHLLTLLMPSCSKFTRKKEYVMCFEPRYPLTRFTFTIA